MLYHYNDNDNVLLLKMFQILGKAPTFNERKVGAYSKGGHLERALIRGITAVRSFTMIDGKNRWQNEKSWFHLMMFFVTYFF